MLLTPRITPWTGLLPSHYSSLCLLVSSPNHRLNESAISKQGIHNGYTVSRPRPNLLWMESRFCCSSWRGHLAADNEETIDIWTRSIAVSLGQNVLLTGVADMKLPRLHIAIQGALAGTLAQAVYEFLADYNCLFFPHGVWYRRKSSEAA